jgi:nitric oxide reductase NorD protein
LQCLHWLEFARLDSCLRKTLPGLHRQMNELRAGSQMGDEWQAFATLLGKQGSGVEASIALLPQVYPLTLPQPCCYMGRLYPERAEGIRQARILKEKDVFRSAIAQMTNDKKPSEPAKEPSAMEAGENNRLTLEKLPDPEQPNGFSFQLNLDGQPIIPPENVKSLMDSIIQDLGQIPEDYLVAAGDGGYRLTHDSHEKKPEDVWKGTYHEEGAHLYNEWDFNRRHYRKNWCVLRELSVHPGEIGFVEATLGKYYGQIAQLKRTFEILRGEEKQLKKQKHGTDIDLNAVVEAYADLASGMELSERLFTKLHKIERNIAVMFMVDMSGSTKGWINDAEREALVLLCEALEVLGDRYAIYGFSGITRKRCEVYKVKGFDEPYSTLVKQRIAGITPQDYTRMGVTIRHLSKLLEEQEARTKLLITLSDGKPDDYDTYRGEYGIEDTRQALIEAKQKGIHSFCITIDSEAREYLPHMYGAVNYTVIDDVKKLPLKMADIYRHITT